MWQRPEEPEAARPGVPIFERPPSADAGDRPDEVARSWAFPSDGETVAPEPSAVSPISPPQAPDPIEADERPDGDREIDTVDVDLRSNDPPGRSDPRRRVAMGLAAVALLVLALLATRSIFDGSTARADGPRLPTDVDERWAISLGDRFVLDAVIADGAIVVVRGRVGRGGAELTAHDPVDGAELWRRTIDAVVTNLHLADGDAGQVVVVTVIEDLADGRSSFGVEPVSGDPVWERSGDGVALARPEMGNIALVRTGRPPSEPGLELIDMTTGETIPPVGGRLVGIGADGEVLTIDEEGDVRRLDVAAEPQGAIDSVLVATTDPDRSNVFELAGRFFAADDDGVVEIGFAADARRLLLDRRPDAQRAAAMPAVTESSFFVQIDERHAVMLGADGAMGVELAGDELRVRWSEDTVTELPRRVDGGRTLVEAVAASRPGDAVGSGIPTRLVDAVTGESLFEFMSIRDGDIDQPVDGTLAWRSVTGTISDDADVERAGTVVALDLDGSEMWSIDDVIAGAFLGDRVVVIEQADGETSNLVFFDEGPGSRD